MKSTFFKNGLCSIFQVASLVLFFATFDSQSAFCELTSKKIDLDGNGFKEAMAYYDENKALSRLQVDGDIDGKYETTVYYKNGFRETAEKDSDRDGKPDTWIKYYFIGLPWIISRDRNRDGAPDYWRYLKNGFVYKKERDRNFDGKVDLAISYEGKPDLRFDEDEEAKEFERKEDNDYDGVFEKVEKRKLEVSDSGIDPSAGAVDEISG